MKRIRAGCVAAILSTTACVSSYELVGRTRAPTLPGQVRLYLQPPADRYEQIAVLNTSSKHSFSFTAEGKSDVVVRRLKEQAAKLGANGILLQEIADEPGESVGTGVETELVRAHGTIDLGLGASGIMSQKFGRGIAIYLPSDHAPSN